MIQAKTPEESRKLTMQYLGISEIDMAMIEALEAGEPGAGDLLQLNAEGNIVPVEYPAAGPLVPQSTGQSSEGHQ